MTQSYGQPPEAVRGAIVEEVVPVLPPGIYPARFGSISQGHNDNGIYWLLTFVARDGDNDVEITATTSPRITPKTKMGKWLTTMLGRPIAVGEHIDFDDVIDTPVQLVVEINDAGYSRIANILPYKASNW